MDGLKGKIAIVTGASRGAGRGIALVLGEHGATVYVTGRSVRGGPTTRGWPETIQETAEMVTERGGEGIPVPCDHTIDSEVEALFQRVLREQDGIDLLVNNVWGGYERIGDADFGGSFWSQPMWRWDAMFVAGVRAHFLASRLAAPNMIARRKGLIVNTTFRDGGKYLSNLPYDVAKTAVNRMAYGLGLELKEHNVAAIALSPGWMRTEAVLRTVGTDEAHWREAAEDLSRTESPLYIGRAVVALATDPAIMSKTGLTLTVGDLAREYGFTDYDGRQPPAFVIPDVALRD